MKGVISLFVFLFCVLIQIFAQNNSPEVTNVSFIQRIDGSLIVDINYDLNDVDGDTMFITVEVSDDSGYTWNFSCDSTIGDAGLDILSGVGKQIEWDFGAEHPQISGNSFKIKILADDGINLGTVTDIDGNIYQTIKIGTQWWMAENLNVIHYNNGDTIPNIVGSSAWANPNGGAYCNYRNNVANAAIYGRLYNWYVIQDIRGISPQGWHVPTDSEWQILVNYLGGSSVAGGKLKEAGTVHWQSPNAGATNSSGFTALPGGSRVFDSGSFALLGHKGYFWSSSVVGPVKAYYRKLDHDDSLVFRYFRYKNNGSSIRCIRLDSSFGISGAGAISSITSIEDLNDESLKYRLDQNYPNPFNPLTKIEFKLPAPTLVKIEVFNLLGQKIETLINKNMSIGLHEVEFAPRSIPSGLYLYRIEAGNFQEIKKMILLR